MCAIRSELNWLPELSVLLLASQRLRAGAALTVRAYHVRRVADERRGHASGVVGEHLVLLGRRVAHGGVLEDEGEEGGGVARWAAVAVERERLQEAGLEVVRSGVLGVLGLAQRVCVVATDRTVQPD